MGIIFALSSIPGEDIPDVGIPNIDKAVHFAEYLVLGLLTMRAMLNHNINLAKMTFFAIIISLSYALFDEWRQQFVSGRGPDIFDFLSDFAGLVSGVFLYRRRNRIAADKTV